MSRETIDRVVEYVCPDGIGIRVAGIAVGACLGFVATHFSDSPQENTEPVQPTENYTIVYISPAPNQLNNV